MLNGTVNRFDARGFEHEEEAAWRDGATAVGFRSETFGDAAAVELEISNLAEAVIRVEGSIGGYVKIGNPLDGAPFVHRPDFAWEIRGADLLTADGGALPRDVSGSLLLEPVNGPHGHRPLFFRARQTDDAKVWTSALYVSFEI